MIFTAGSKLGPYEILSAIGAGGQGEVYKARDTRLNRTVAIKVLSSHFSDNAEMKARFRARGANDRGPQPPQHLRALRCRPSRRHRLPRDGVSGRANPRREVGERRVGAG